MRDVFAELPLFIREGEQIVGQRATHLGACAVYPEFNLNVLTAETTPSEIWDYWHERTLPFQHPRGVSFGSLRSTAHDPAVIVGR